jgi:hypothetical protein
MEQVHQSVPAASNLPVPGCRLTTRVRLRIMKRPDGFSVMASLEAPRPRASVQPTGNVSQSQPVRVPFLDVEVEAGQAVISSYLILHELEATARAWRKFLTNGRHSGRGARENSAHPRRCE